MEDREAYTLTDAARILGTSEGALRQRIRRGTLDSYKEEGRVYVYLPHTDTVQDDVHTPESQTLISEIQARVELLEQELECAHERDRETRRLLAAALERIPPQLEAPENRPESSVTPSNIVPNTPGPPETPAQGEDTTSPRGSEVTRATMSLFAVGAAAAAGVANPLLIDWLGNPFWLALLVLWALPPIFGIWLGRNVALDILVQSAALPENRPESDRPLKVWEVTELYSRLRFLRGLPPRYVVTVGMVTVLSSLAAFWFGGVSKVELRIVLGVAMAQGIVAAMFVFFTSLLELGRARQRREAAQHRSGGGSSAEVSKANRQAVIGLVGTIFTAIVTFIGVVVQVLYGGGSGG
jgi:hypothetical protein